MEETNIVLKTDLKETNIVDFIIHERAVLKKFISLQPEFFSSLEPVKVKNAPPLIFEMAKAGQIAEVGPMAAVAGTIAQFCLDYLLKSGSKSSIVDNGGDVALKTQKSVNIGLYAGMSPLSGSIGFQIKPRKTPLGICTSSGTVGHSISFGKADSVTVFAEKASYADSLATSIANQANEKNELISIENCLSWAEELKEYFQGVLIIMGETAGTIGKIPPLVETDKKLVLGDMFNLY